MLPLRPVYPLRSPRLALRPLTTADTTSLVADRSMESVCRYVPFEPMDDTDIGRRLADGWARSEITAEQDEPNKTT